MKLITLIENLSYNDALSCEHGLSLYIEACGKRILFDAGETGAFADNAEKLGVDLSLVEVAILSHGHSDHSGGLLRFLSVNESAPVYLRKSALDDYYGSKGDYIGLDERLKCSSRLRFVGDSQKIGDGLTVISGTVITEHQPIDSAGLTVRRNGLSLPDSFCHEQYLLIEEGGKRILISGCSHRGILNIAQHFQPDVLVGGFHFFKQEPGSRMIKEAADQLLEYQTIYYTGHCTGEEQYLFMKKIMADRLRYLSTGTELQL